MFDLMALAFQADITRISAFMMAREVSYRTFPQIGVPDPFHATSHHQDNPEKLEKLTKINTYHVSLIAYFLDKLRSKQDGDGTLLDHSLVLFGSSMSNSNLHNHAPLPVFVAGGACGRMKGGRHIKYPGRHAHGEPAGIHAHQSRAARRARRRQQRHYRSLIHSRPGGKRHMRIEQLTKWSMAALLSVASYAATNGITALVDAAKNQDQESVRALLKAARGRECGRSRMEPRRCIGPPTGTTWRWWICC